jgi:hypothetical protein
MIGGVNPICNAEGLTLYLINWKLPSGGTKDTILSDANLEYLTQGWNEQSSMIVGSLKVSKRSGIPLSFD